VHPADDGLTALVNVNVLNSDLLHTKQRPYGAPFGHRFRRVAPPRTPPVRRLHEDEDRTDSVREAVERELKRRERRLT
jgi:hypothetical protein